MKHYTKLALGIAIICATAACSGRHSAERINLASVDTERFAHLYKSMDQGTYNSGEFDWIATRHAKAPYER